MAQTLNLGRLYGRAKRRPVNLTTKQSSELNSVGPETPKTMIFLVPTTSGGDVIATDKTSKTLRPSGDAISKNENWTLKTVFDKLSKKIFFDFRFKIFYFRSD